MSLHHFKLENDVWFEASQADVDALRKRFDEDAGRPINMTDAELLDNLFIRQFVHHESVVDILGKDYAQDTDRSGYNMRVGWRRMTGWKATEVTDNDPH